MMTMMMTMIQMMMTMMNRDGGLALEVLSGQDAHHLQLIKMTELMSSMQMMVD